MSIVIKEDKSYLSDVDLKAVEKGLAEMSVHSIRLEYEYTEEQKQENKRMADLLSREEWAKRCEEKRLIESKAVEKVVKFINEHFKIYKYKDNDFAYSSDEWDLFFWCNNGDMSYVRLSPNRNRSNKQQLEDIESVLRLVKNISSENVVISIQYDVEYNDEKVKEIVERVYNNIQDQWVQYMGFEGKVKKIRKGHDGDVVYGFFKKRARKKYYSLSKDWFCRQHLTNR